MSPVLLLIHGWGFDAGFWDPLRRQLPELPCVAWDLGFHGAPFRHIARYANDDIPPIDRRKLYRYFGPDKTAVLTLSIPIEPLRLDRGRRLFDPFYCVRLRVRRNS